MTRVFVYGTLLAGEANHGLLGRARFLGAAATPASFALYDLGAYPAMIAGGDRAIAGEVYEVDAATLGALDDLEDHPAYYQRTEITLADGSRAATYLLSAADVVGHAMIGSGSWRAR
ncbi:MAG TPA: gamma-glutamylcyclotransferase family protein [Kofleriaceae bacterium]|nr:gamma-glutamylcyclotransferase family protein [Kofleriaceae bacterium]